MVEEVTLTTLYQMMIEMQKQMAQNHHQVIEMIADTKKELRAEMKQLGEELRTEMKQMKTDILSEVGEVIVETMGTISKNQMQAFQNHEKRIVRLEDLHDISHEVLQVHEQEEPPYDAN